MKTKRLLIALALLCLPLLISGCAYNGYGLYYRGGPYFEPTYYGPYYPHCW